MEKVTENIFNIGVNDKKIDLFESQYKVPDGMSYNSYVINDDKIAIFDTVEENHTKEWLKNLEECLNDKEPDYLIILHLEPDHSGGIKLLCQKYPRMKIVGNNKTFTFLPQFCSINDLEERKVEVKENDKIFLGKHELNFIMAPMVHWPETMMCYESNNNILFSADAFGKFGTRDIKDNWVDEARRFYINIVAKYGVQVQNVLNKISNTKIQTICSLHGPVLKDNLDLYIEKYDKWSRYEPELPNGILVVYCSIHGNTKNAVLKFVDILYKKGAENIRVIDLCRFDMSEAISQSFRFGKIVLASSSYNASVFPAMETFLRLLKDKNYQNRIVGIIENGTWAPSAAKTMKSILNEMKNISVLEPEITIKSTLSEDNIEKFNDLADNIIHV